MDAGLQPGAIPFYAQPVTSQRRRRNRAPIVASRTAISTASAAQTPRTPKSPATAIASAAPHARKATTIDPAMNGPSLAPIRIPSSAKTAPLNGCMSAKIGQRSAHWASTSGSALKHEGCVRFEENRGGTRVTVQLRYVPPGGAFGHAVASLFGADPKSEMDADLLRMKSMIETGRPPHDAARPLPRES